MRTLNHVVLVLVLASFGFASFGCGDDSSSPVAPSSTPLMEAPSYAPAAAPSVRPVSSSSPDVDTVAPGDGRYGPNAYDFFAHVDSGMLRVALVEDAMATMRTASQPHRMRQVEVYHVISEPRHVLQTHGDPLYSGTVRLSGRLELPPIAVESCAPHEWIVVQAAELSDDRYDGWRNAPCPQPGGAVVGSDGSGPGWERSEHGPPPRNFPPGAPEITNPGNKRYQQGAKIEAFRIVVTGGDDVTVEVSDLPPGLVWSPDSGRVSGTVATNAEERAYRVKVTASDGTASRSLTFTITIGTTSGGGSNRAPKISDQIDRRFSPGERVQFTIAVTDHEGDTVTVDVSGLPSWLMWEPDPGRVRGIVPAEAEERAYPVMVTASDGTDDADPVRFTITIGTNRPPEITNPGDKTYAQGQPIEAFGIAVTDLDNDDVRVTVTDLPDGLAWSDGRVSGTVAANAPPRAYPVMVTASDGTDSRSLTFTITIETTGGGGSNRAPKISDQIDRRFSPGERVQFTIAVTDHEGDTVTVDVSGLPSWLMWEPDPGRVRGIVPAEAEERAYPVMVTASDGTDDADPVRFTITIAENHPPVISHPGDKRYQQGTAIEAFRIVVSDPDGDDVTVRVSGLPDGLVWSPESRRVSGTVDEDAEVRAYPVRVTASDGAADAEPVTFRITVRPSWFNRENYDALVYNAYDGPIENLSRVLDGNELSSFKVVFSTVGLMPGGRFCQIPQGVISQLANATVPAVQAATGSSWSVRPVQSSSPLDDPRFGLRPSAADVGWDPNDPRANDGWHTVEFVHWDLIPGKEHRPTGSAHVGYPDLPMWIYLDDSCTIAAIDRGGVEATYVHEIGHVVGFSHVDDSSWRMYPRGGMVRAREFGGYAEDEHLHMRRAYQLGPDRVRGTRIWLRSLLQQPGPWPGRRTTRKPPPIMVDD